MFCRQSYLSMCPKVGSTVRIIDRGGGEVVHSGTAKEKRCLFNADQVRDSVFVQK